VADHGVDEIEKLRVPAKLLIVRRQVRRAFTRRRSAQLRF
jgi:hypothetical protein